MADPKGPVFNPVTDLRTILLLFTALWLFWFYTGGPQRFEERQKPFLTTPATIGADEYGVYRDPKSKQYGSIPSIKIGSLVDNSTTTSDNKIVEDEDGEGSIMTTSETDTTSIGGNLADTKYQGRDPYTGELYNSTYSGLGDNKIESSKEELSAYRSLEKPIIRLTKSQVKTSDLLPQINKSYIKIDFSSLNKSALKVTGLSIRDMFGKSSLILGASNLPYQGRINEESNVIIEPDSVVYIIEGHSPIGVSFRINKCIDHLARYQNFYPPLLFDVDGEQALLGDTYNNCIDSHKDDLDFYSNDWRIYLKDKAKIWSDTGGLIRLMDRRGRSLASMFY